MKKRPRHAIVKRPVRADTLVLRLRRTLGTKRAVLLADVINGSYYPQMAKYGLRLRGRHLAKGWAYWAEPMTKNGRA